MEKRPPYGSEGVVERQPREPSWWVREVVIATLVALLAGLAVGLPLLWFQRDLDDKRLQQDIQAAREAADEGDRRENLRFVRERSSPEKIDRTFNGIDLEGRNLGGLDLAGANFEAADLRNTRLGKTKLANGWLACANLSNTTLHFTVLTDAYLGAANLSGAVLVGTYLDGASLYGADLSGANLKHANYLNGADIRMVHYDEKTVWPDNFPVPENSPYTGWQCKEGGPDDVIESLPGTVRLGCPPNLSAKRENDGETCSSP